MNLKVNYFVDATMLVCFFACAFTGVLKLPELNVAMSDGAYLAVTAVHDWSGIASLVLAAVHVLLHAKWFASATKAIFSPVKKRLPLFGKKSATAALIVFLLAAPIGAWAYGRGGANPTVPQGIVYPAGSLKDGVYDGTATGYMPGLAVRVTVMSGAIKSVEIVSNSETPRWFTRVSGVIPGRVVAAQSTAVDTVSGATCSSEGILSAVEDALKKAK